MTRAFADTFYYLALMNARDEGHAAAVRFSELSSIRVVTTAWVLMEIGDGLAEVRNRRLFGVLVEAIRSDRRTRVVGASGEVFEEAVRLYRSRPDKEWSLTDCTSFIVMRRLKLRDALTGDRHFDQAGFRSLLR